jgi:hypothetical protein
LQKALGDAFFQLVADGEAGFDFGDDAVLFGEGWWNGDIKVSYLLNTKS